MICLFHHLWTKVDFIFTAAVILSLFLISISGYAISQTPQGDKATNSTLFFEIPYLDRSLDAYAHAPGLSLAFYRTYIQDSTHPPENGPLGCGWTHSFNLSLKESSDGIISFQSPDGFIWFKRDENGTYSTAPGYKCSLTGQENGTFVLTGWGNNIYRFREDMLLESISDRHGNSISAIYDKKKRLCEIKHSNGESIRIAYNILGKIALLTDPSGGQTNYEYTLDGNDLIKAVTSDGVTTLYAYEGNGDDHRLSTITFSDNTHLIYTYDSQGRVSSQEKDSGLDKIEYRYEKGSTRIIGASGAETTIRLNNFGQPLEVIDPAGSVTRFGYDSSHRVIGVSDPLNHTYNLSYDDAGNLVEVVDPMGSKTKFGYAAGSGEITYIEDRLGNTLTLNYDSKGNLTSIMYPDGTSDKFSYDQRGLLKGKNCRDGSFIEYIFNDRGLLTSKVYPDGTSSDYVYDKKGRMVGASCSSVEMSFNYDDAANLIGVTYPGGRAFKYEYDERGRMARAEDPDGRAVKYEYDEVGRLTCINGEDEKSLATYQYDNSGRCIKKTLGNGAYITYKYDLAGRISRLADYSPDGALRTYINYTYDPSGNLILKETPEGKECYTYDRLGQLTGVLGPDGEIIEVEYDREGNRKKISRNETVVDYSINSLNQYTSVGSRKLGYDKNGNLVSDVRDGAVNYKYDIENKLIGVQTPEENTNYTYDPFGMIYSRQDSNGTSNFLWDRDQIAIEEDGEHNTIAKYDWGRSQDEILKMSRDGEDLYYSQDGLLSVNCLMASSGDVLESYKYDPFGELKAAQLSHDNHIFFTGTFRDIQTQLCYNRHRYYSPALGRFITVDPLGPVGGTNFYEYDGNRFTTGRDPYGLYYSLGYTDTIGIEVVKETLREMYREMGFSEAEPISPVISLSGDESYGSLGGWIGDMPNEYEDVYLNSGPASQAIYGVVSRIRMPVLSSVFVDGENSGTISGHVYYGSGYGVGKNRDTLIVGGIDQNGPNPDDNPEYKRLADIFHAMYFPTYYSHKIKYLSDGLEVNKAAKGTKTDQNGLIRDELNDKTYDIIIAYSGGTTTVVTAMAEQNVKASILILVSPIKGWFPKDSSFDYDAKFKEKIQKIIEKGTKIVVIQSPDDELPLGEKYQYTFSEGENPNIEVHNIDLTKWGIKKGITAHIEIFFKYVAENLKIDENGKVTLTESPPPAQDNADATTAGTQLKLNQTDIPPPPPSCPPFCDDVATAGAPDAGSPSATTNIDKEASYGDNRDENENSEDWDVRSFAPVKKADNNPLTLAATEFSDPLKDSVPGSDVGSVCLKTEDNEVTGGERYTLYRREVWPDSTSSSDTVDGWTPIPSEDVGPTLTVMGYRATDSIDYLSDILEQLRMIQENNRLMVEREQQYLQMESQNSQLQKIRDQQMQISQSLFQERQLGGVDFSSIKLNYISVRGDPSGEKDFNFVLKAKRANKDEKAVDLENATALSAKAFLTGLAVHNSKLWVNLNPWEPDRIVDEDLSHTDVGRIMLEADLQMKKDFCRYEDPCNSTTGVQHWKILESKRFELVKRCMERYPGEIKDARNVLFSAVTRHWIIPDALNAYGDGKEIYIDDATLTIRSDPVSEHAEYRIVNQDARYISRECQEYLNQSSKEYSRYAMEVEEKNILPLVVQNINKNDRYSDLRQIYVSLGLAQYYKDHRKPDTNLFSDIIRSHNLTGVMVVTSWNPEIIWNSYVQSFSGGEYKCWQNETSTNSYEDDYGRKITETKTDCRYYQEGGVDFTNISSYINIAGELETEKKETLRKAIYTLYAEEGDNYYFGDGIYLLPSVE